MTKNSLKFRNFPKFKTLSLSGFGLALGLFGLFDIFIEIKG